MVPLLVPYLLLFIAIISIVFVVCRKWKIVFSLLIICIFLNLWAECFPIKTFSLINSYSSPKVRVMCFNIKGTSPDMPKKAVEITKLINSYSPDIVFVSEIKGRYKPQFDSLLYDKFPYTTFTRGESNCFYSKFQLNGWRKLGKDNDRIGAYACTIGINNDSIVVIGCHLTSNNYASNRKYITPDSVVSHNDFITYIHDVRRAYEKRTKEAYLICEEINNSKFPVILMGDFNDVGGSKTIKIIENARLRDAWWEKGLGYGATIHYPLPYRIDHIMYSKELKLEKIKVVDSEGLSDHDALYSEFVIQK